ncbi:MAG: glutathione synthase, partial [Burkholderiaceae bacterium]
MARLLFVADPIETFKAYKDSTVAMMAAAQSRGHEVFACEPSDLSAQTRNGQTQVAINARGLRMADQPQDA